MSRPALALDFRFIRNEPAYGSPTYLKAIIKSLDVHSDKPDFISSLPFSPADITVGSETELQAVVQGSRYNVDLPLLIERSNYFANIVKRTASGDAPKEFYPAWKNFLI